MRSYREKFPSRIPPNYKLRVLSRLLPSQEQILTFGKAELFALEKERRKLETLIDADPVRFFQPNRGGQFEFLTFDDPNVQGLYFFAGNKSGKTTAAAILAAEAASGRVLWGREWRKPASRTRVPSIGCIYAEDFGTHEETIVPTLLSWLPDSELEAKALERGPTGSVNKIHLKNRSIIYLRTYDQGYAKAEGKDYDWIWDDEPPPRDIYTAQWRGLVANKGHLWIAATLLSQAWLYDEMNQPFVRVFDASMYENEWLNQQARANFEAMLSEDEKQIRIYGKPSTLSGMIYPNFKDGGPFVTPQIEVPWDIEKERAWPVVMGVDPHERKPLHVEWGWVTPDNGIWWFDWALVPAGPLTDIFEFIKLREQSHPAPTTVVVMDPNRGKATQMNGLSWQEAFEENDYYVLLGIDDMAFGHAQVREMLLKPQMRWMEACRGKAGPVHQMLRYTWQDWRRGSRFEKEPKEKPNETNKDFPDIHRYVAAAKLDYKLLSGQDSGTLHLNGSSHTSYLRGANSGILRVDPRGDAGDLLLRFSSTDFQPNEARNYRRR